MTRRKHHEVAREIVDRYRLIEALHTCYFTQLSVPVAELSPEFFYAVGDILEGKQLDGSRIPSLDMAGVRAFLQQEKP